MKNLLRKIIISVGCIVVALPGWAGAESIPQKTSSDTIWLSFLSILSTFIAIFLTLLYRSIFQWRKEILGELDKFCRRNENDHGLMWNRINFHGHTAGGHVVITRGAEDFRPPEKD